MAGNRTAAQRTLGITELLESILLDATVRDVLLSQRVNKMFQATISNSSPLQHMLWFKTPSNSTSRLSTPQMNPLLTNTAHLRLLGQATRRYCNIEITASGLQHIRAGASFAKTSIWRSCSSDMPLGVLIMDNEGPRWRNWLVIHYGELGFEDSPTVEELANKVLGHKKTNAWTEKEWWAGHELTYQDDEPDYDNDC